jgi:hypothetical protein
VLEELHYRKIANKANNNLICPSWVEPVKGVKETRSFANVVFSNGIWLDYDGGEVSPELFASIFPVLRMTVYSSYNSTKSNLRYRIYIPTSSAMICEDYKMITGQIVREVKAQGHSIDGFDTSKRHAVSLLYLPSQPKDLSGSYFQVFKDGG